ncbi:hypothetical protein JTB14_004323 [Gonioctena quinquepunctata]|nr:hypothetical protein JTB14_004323 [Gonioctena quinquepunctata]
MPDFGVLSSKTVTEVLMLEMKMCPSAKTYLVSGYPRNMRDVVEYSEKIQMVQGVILIQWRQKVLERQIDYGAKLGQVVLSLARMELNNFYKNVIPVAEYFDQSNMLISINGERAPADVYTDFRDAIFRILGSQDNPPVFRNGKVAPVPDDVTTELPTVGMTKISILACTATLPIINRTRAFGPHRDLPTKAPDPDNIGESQPAQLQVAHQSFLPAGTVGHRRPWKQQGCSLRGSCQRNRLASHKPWKDPENGGGATRPRFNRDVAKLRESISNGELVPQEEAMKDMAQVSEFETKFKQKPTMILLDCSKLQLGRGRLDDSVTAFRRRLEIFRKSSLPMLKAMDNIGRLSIVDGDTDSAAVHEDFKNVVREHIEYIRSQPQNESIPVENGYIPNGNVIPNGNDIPNGRRSPNGHHLPNGNTLQNGYANGHVDADTELQDLEDEEIETISSRVGNGVAHTMANGVANTMANGVVHTISNGVAHIKANGVANGVKNMMNGHMRAPQVANGFVGKTVYNEVNYMDGHI